LTYNPYSLTFLFKKPQTITDNLFATPTTRISNLNKKQLSKLLDLATSNTIFLFNNQLYQQIDGMAMGSPLGLAYANAFLCHHEEEWLNNCPPDFKPIVYKRYVDDCFLIFENERQSLQFLNYLNGKHSNIVFTSEGQLNNSLSFLDVSVSYNAGTFSSSVFHKPTTTLLGTNFFSFIPFKFKTSGISSRIFRAFRISSSWMSFNNEIEYIRQYANFNLYPPATFFKFVHSFLENIFHPRTPVSSAPKLKIYLKIPFLGPKTDAIINHLKPVLTNSFPYVQFVFIPINRFKISSFFRLKDTISLPMRSSVVYLFTCADCQTRYIGQTGLQLTIRISKHLGIAHRTGRLLSSPEYSAIRSHASNTGHSISANNFSILGSATNQSDRKILESLHINSVSSELNVDGSSTQLFSR